MARPRIVGRVATRLLQQLASGSWSPGGVLPASRQLASQFCVAQRTMQASVRELAALGLLDVRPRYPTRVLPGATQRAKELVATRLSLVSSRRLAILMSDGVFPFPLPPHAFFAWLADLVVKESDRHGIATEILEWPLREQGRVVQSLLHGGYGAALAIGMSEAYLPSLVQLQAHEFPVMLFNRRFPQLQLPTVNQDDFTALKYVTEQLISYGHRRIHLVTYHDYGVLIRQMEWINEWLSFLGEKGLLEDLPAPVCYIPKGVDPRGFIEHILAEPHRATGLIFAIGPLLEQFLSVAPHDHIRVPDELSLAMFGRSDLILQKPWRPALTTLTGDFPRMAECMVETARRMLAGELNPPSVRIPLKVTLTGSIGPVPKAVPS